MSYKSERMQKIKNDFFRKREIEKGTDISKVWDELNKIQKERESLDRMEKLWRTSLIIVGNNKLREELNGTLG